MDERISGILKNGVEHVLAFRDVHLRYLLIDYYLIEKQYMHALRESQALLEQGITDVELYIKLFTIYDALTDLKESSKYTNLIFKSMENDKSNMLYIKALLEAISESCYDEIYTDDEYVNMITDIYEIIRPRKENILDIPAGFFRPLRIGLMSSDFHSHPVGCFVMSLMKNRLPFSTFQYYCYNTNREYDDGVTDIIRDSVVDFRDLSSYEDSEISDTILGDNLDILFDLNGLSNGNKFQIIVSRLAPVQFSWIGFPGTTGLFNVDYTIVDNYTDPKGMAEKFYTEKLLHMKNTFLCYPLDYDDTVEPPPFLKNNYITFGSFNNGLKFTDGMLKVWARIMNIMKDSRLVIKSITLVEKEPREYLIKRFAQNGIDILRVKFDIFTPYNEYTAGYNEVDIILDTYPFNGATTTCDAFNMGVPVVSLYGRRHVSRVGLSMLSNIGLADLAVESEDEYVAKVIELAGDRERLTYLRRNLREMMKNSPLSDTYSFRQELECRLRYIIIKKCIDEGKSIDYEMSSIPGLLREAFTGLSFIRYAFMEGIIENREIEDIIISDLSRLQASLCGKMEALYVGDKQKLYAIRNYRDLSEKLIGGIEPTLACAIIDKLFLITKQLC